ncbi:hypothetical protein DA803_02600 [[Mycoplasma] phocae]|uniref:Uncharacterized protein n=1 Tax=[Mycoplasma] phocae TaxID=142651 RepID=A0A2Z5IQF7_9BACT|nr:hypothetical protein DA803_02600 [[Mycoplasma] phocae]
MIPIEIKFSQNHSGHDTKKLSSRPVWNSNLPKSNAIYLYAISGADTTFFKGSDVIDNDVIKILINYFKNLDKNTDSLNNALSKYENNFGFYPYIRKAYEQKLEKSTYFENGKKAIESYFSSKREQRENNVINFFERIENESDN